MNTIDVRCPKCTRLLFRASGIGTVIEIKCPNCKSMVQYPSLEPVLITLTQRQPRRPGPTHIKMVVK